jgi:hypothetical protein
VDVLEQRDLIRYLAGELKKYTRELMAYQLFAHLLKQAGCIGVDDLLDEARKNPALAVQFEKNFEGFDELLPPADHGLEERVKELLEKWRPKGGSPN